MSRRECGELVSTSYCTQRAIEVRLSCPEGRPDAVAAYCQEHGGKERALEEAERNWGYAAPASVGDMDRVLEAGSLGLQTPDAYVVVRQTTVGEGGVWLAWLGLGSMLQQVPNPAAVPRQRGGRGRRPSDGTKSFPSRETALSTALEAWRDRVTARVAEIREARGGTLEWGLDVEPLDEPVIIVLEQGDERTAWEVASGLSRRTPVGASFIRGLRSSGECA